MKHRKSAVSLLLIVLKALLAAVGALFLLSVAIYTVTTVATNDGAVTEAESISWCEEEYLERNFAALYDQLDLFELYGESYAVYWEAVDAYRMLALAKQHAAGMEAGLPESAVLYEAALQQLQAMAKDVQHERNAALLAEFFAEAESFRPETQPLSALP
ncbi:MAG: hypothetical protein IKV55_07300 [Oscillospiraceae bacterium]|nr:hypothetical protein [Oscillospiraceae bacterium]